jgi:predicted transcriptional regulator
LNRAFIQAGQRSEKQDIKEAEEHLYFEDAASLLKLLSNQRLVLLSTLLQLGENSVRALSKELRRNYKNVYNDVQSLKQAGLIRQKPSKKIFVPWQKILTEIDHLAA